MPLLSASSLSNDNWRDELGLDIALGELLLIDNGKIALAHPRAKDLHPNRLSSSLIGLLPLNIRKTDLGARSSHEDWSRIHLGIVPRLSGVRSGAS